MKRRIDEDCTFTYVVSKEAWYASALIDELPSLNISAESDGGGVKWEFNVQEHQLGGKPCLRLRVFDDAFEAFNDIPEFFTALHQERPTTLDGLRALLAKLGAVDRTERSRW